MNRRLTGWVAWGALALVIGVPSTEMVWSRAESNQVEIYQGESPAVVVSDEQGENSVVVADEVEEKRVPFFTSLSDHRSVAEDQFTAPFGPQKPDESATVEIATVEPVKAEPVTVEPVTAEIARPIGDPIPIEVRIVGDIGMAGSKKPAVTKPIGEPIPIEFRVLGDTRMRVAVLEPQSDLVEEAKLIAPVPMPAFLRPDTPEHVVVASVGFEREVRASIETIRAQDRDFPPVTYEAGAGETDWWNGDVDFQDDGWRQDSLDLGAFAEGEYAGDSGFNELWLEEQETPGFFPNGSFEDQLPVYHGNGIRMDLVR